MPTQWPRFDPGGLAQLSLVKESKAAANHHHSNMIPMLKEGMASFFSQANGTSVPFCKKRNGKLDQNLHAVQKADYFFQTNVWRYRVSQNTGCTQNALILGILKHFS